MNLTLKKALRTAQTSFPWLVDAKFAMMRRYRNARRKPFDYDFNLIGLFPDTEGALYLDIGANRGQSADAILMQRKNCRIQMFEPNPLLCKKLATYFGNDSRVTINEFGLGDESSEQPLFVPFYKKWMFDGLASFSEEKARSWLRGRMFFYKERHLRVEKVKCRIRRLDELNLNPFFMKLDVQGYEYQALKGGEKTIEKHRPVLLIESAPKPEIMSLLRSFDYEPYAFESGRLMAGAMGKKNTCFMTESRAALVEKFIRPAPAPAEEVWAVSNACAS